MMILPFLLLAPLGGEAIALLEKPSRTFEYSLPAEQWFQVGSAIAIPHAGGRGFACESRGEALAVDCDGDGSLEHQIEGSLDKESGTRTGFLVLTGTRPSGAAMRYGVRLRNSGKGWEWAPSGALTATIEGLGGSPLRLAVIDQDGDGTFGEVGQDALALGSSDTATPFSSTILIGSELLDLTVLADGSCLRLSTHEGARGVLDLGTRLQADGRLLSAVVRSVDGRHSFDLARVEKGARLPVGDYRLERALIGLGDARVEVAQGNMGLLEVREGRAMTLAWGGPTRAEFEFERESGKVVFFPDRVWWYGAAGEEYRAWAPRGKSPEFTIKEKKLGTELLKALFPGSC